MLESGYPKLVLVFKLTRENVFLGVDIAHPVLVCAACLFLGESVAADLSRTFWENIVGNGNL